MKYLGSKARYASEIVPILQGIIDGYEIDTYIEPFAGGFNIIDKVVCENRLGNDIDPLVCELVEAYRERPQLLDGVKMPTREEYYDIRDNPSKYASEYRAAILLFASYNARVYGGCYGAMAKTKDGKIRNYFEESKANFKKQLPNLHNILVGCCDYRDIVFPKKKVLIYCDPPYENATGYEKEFDTTAFWEWCRQRTGDGHIVVVSECIAPPDFVCVWERETETSLDNRGKHKRSEKLYMHESFVNENGTPRMPKTHKIKIAPEYFAAVVRGDKKAEYRYNDRGYTVGDFVVLQEYEGGNYTGREQRAKITHMLEGVYGLPEQWAILSIELVEGGVIDV